MLELIPGMPDNVLAVKAVGEVTSEDYENVIDPAVETILKEHEKIRMLYELGADMTGFSAGAMWQDTKVGMSNLLAFEKIAIVTDYDWIKMSVKAFAFLMPSSVKVFATSESDEARAWIIS